MNWLDLFWALLGLAGWAWLIYESATHRETQLRLRAAELREENLRIELALTSTSLRQSNDAWRVLARKVALDGSEKLDG